MGRPGAECSSDCSLLEGAGGARCSGCTGRAAPVRSGSPTSRPTAWSTWLTRRGVVATPTSVRTERMAEKLDLFRFELTEDQMSQVAGLGLGVSQIFDHRDPDMVQALGARRVG